MATTTPEIVVGARPAVAEVVPARKVLPIYFLVDTSGSMGPPGGGAAAINAAMPGEILPCLKTEASNGLADFRLSVITFGEHANVTLPLTPINSVSWAPITPSGSTPMGEAILLLTQELNQLPPGNLPPLLVLLTDGEPTDDFEGALRDFFQSKWGSKSGRTVRSVILFGSGADGQRTAAFASDPKLVLRPQNTDELRHAISYATVTMSRAGSRSAVAGTGAAVLPPPPTFGVTQTGASTDEDVF